MRKNVILTLIAVLLLNLCMVSGAFAQTTQPAATEQAANVAPADTAAKAANADEALKAALTGKSDEAKQMSWMETFARKTVGSYLTQLFLDGGWVMWPMLALMIWGFALQLWKLVALSYAKINTSALLSQIEPLIKDGKYKEAQEICTKTRGPVASILASGLGKTHGGIAAVEKAIEIEASHEMSFLENGFVHFSTVINLGPMLGFFGTIVGMVEAFRAIAAAGEVDPTIVASGIMIALITTEYGLAIGIPAQFMNNLLLQMVDGLVKDMQRASEKVVDILSDKLK